jgi:hypothetical protein
MKVLVDVDLGSKEIEVDVSGDDLWSTVRSEMSVPDTIWNFMKVANLTNSVFGKIPDALIAELNEHQKKIIGEFFAKQAERFKP